MLEHGDDDTQDDVLLTSMYFYLTQRNPLLVYTFVNEHTF